MSCLREKNVLLNSHIDYIKLQVGWVYILMWCVIIKLKLKLKLIWHTN